MSQQLALGVYGAFIIGLFFLDIRRRAGISPALWLVVAWVMIFGSRPVSAWLNLGGANEISQNELDGNPVDRNVFLFLILAALVVLKRRNVNWQKLFSNNRWLFILYAYLALSAVWSDYGFVSFKRWFKDFGNVIMVLLILTEQYPVRAVQAVFARVAYLYIPLSVLFIKYFPALGKSFSVWTGNVFYHGASLGKNELGSALLVLTLFLVWEIVQMSRMPLGGWRKVEIARNALLLVMAVWLFRQANSATSLACVVVGSIVLAALSTDFVKKRLRAVIGWSLAGAAALLLLSTTVDLKSNVAEMLGRDPTLHGRTAIWETVLAEKTNPLIGTGYYTFWMGGRAEKIAEKNGYVALLNQAHNGYLEMYLNAGAIGLLLLIGFLLSGLKRIARQLLTDPDWGGMKLVCCLIVAIHNWSEASFFISGPLWFVLLLVAVNYRHASQKARRPVPVSVSIDPEQAGRETVPVPGSSGAFAKNTQVYSPE